MSNVLQKTTAAQSMQAGNKNSLPETKMSGSDFGSADQNSMLAKALLAGHNRTPDSMMTTDARVQQDPSLQQNSLESNAVNQEHLQHIQEVKQERARLQAVNKSQEVFSPNKQAELKQVEALRQQLNQMVAQKPLNNSDVENAVFKRISEEQIGETAAYAKSFLDHVRQRWEMLTKKTNDAGSWKEMSRGKQTLRQMNKNDKTREVHESQDNGELNLHKSGGA